MKENKNSHISWSISLSLRKCVLEKILFPIVHSVIAGSPLVNDITTDQDIICNSMSISLCVPEEGALPPSWYPQHTACGLLAHGRLFSPFKKKDYFFLEHF